MGATEAPLPLERNHLAFLPVELLLLLIRTVLGPFLQNPRFYVVMRQRLRCLDQRTRLLVDETLDLWKPVFLSFSTGLRYIMEYTFTHRPSSHIVVFDFTSTRIGPIRRQWTEEDIVHHVNDSFAVLYHVLPLCTDLYFASCFPSASTTGLRQLTILDAPMLENLTFMVDGDVHTFLQPAVPPFTVGLPLLPRLRFAKFTGVGVQWLTQASCSSLRCLALNALRGISAMHGPRMLEVLRALPALEQLSLVGVSCFGLSEFWGTRVLMPRLKKLHLEVDDEPSADTGGKAGGTCHSGIGQACHASSHSLRRGVVQIPKNK
ncbi:hypothetical protein C8R46DRAFT_1221244 [Mycena filopes]|nr:hypothetical protein C8R46DRAFT_1221244 [Mycena filopes]